MIWELQVVPGQAGGGSFKFETHIAYRAEQRLPIGCCQALCASQHQALAEAFTQRQGSFYTETGKLVHRDREAFSHNKLLHRACFHTQQAFTHSKLLHTEAFAHSKLSHREALTQRKAFTQRSCLQRVVFTQRRFYIQKLLHREAFTQRSFYTGKLLHTEDFTHRSFYTQRAYTHSKPLH